MSVRFVAVPLNESRLLIRYSKSADTVARGDQIGLSGSTGYSTGPHAHVMRQQDCGGDGLSCESMPLVFGDVEGDGVPDRDDYVTSGNCQ